MARHTAPSDAIAAPSGAPLGEVAPVMVRIPGAVKMTGLSRTRIFALIKCGELEAIKVGGSTLVIVDSIHRFVDRQRTLQHKV